MPTQIPVRPTLSYAAGMTPLNGRKVLAIICAFFGVIFAMNGVFLYFAFSTFGGVDAAGAYRRNFLLTSNIVAAERQEKLGWQVDGAVQRNEAGVAQVEIRARDRNGSPIDIASIRVELQRPADRRHDRAITAQRTASGQFRGSIADVDPGQWLLVVTMTDAKGERFLSRNRVMLK